MHCQFSVWRGRGEGLGAFTQLTSAISSLRLLRDELSRRHSLKRKEAATARWKIEVKTNTPHLLSAVLVPLVTIVIGLGGPLGQAQPPNDMFTNRIALTGTNITITGSNVSATMEAGEPCPCDSDCGASVWWSWTAPFSGFVMISTAGSSFDTIMGVYTGASVWALRPVEINDDEDYPRILTSRVFFEVTPGQTYQVAVEGCDGAVGTVQLQVQLEPSPLAPAWVLLDPYGDTVYSSNYAGKVVILDFWATSCEPCKAEIPAYVLLQDKYGGDGLVIVGLSVDTTPEAVVDFLATYYSPHLNFQVVMSDGPVEQAYGGIERIPTTFIVDRHNVIRKKYVAMQSCSTFEAAIIPLLYGNASLTCLGSGKQMVLCWRTNALAFTLESATNLANPSWSTCPILPTLVNDLNTVTLPTTGVVRYFRLRLPY
jgi:thiol-disulfide isomerase/thioredoxin